MFSKVLLILSLASVVFGTVFITTPVAGTSYAGGQSAQVKWQDDGKAPSIVDWGLASVSIYVGNSQQQTNIKTVNASVNVSGTNSIEFTVDPTMGPNSSEYFIRMQSLTIVDASLSKTESLAFSAKFSLTNMTGNFSQTALAQIAGQSTAPLAGQSSTSTPASTSIPPTTTTASKKPTSASAAVPSGSTTKTSSARGVKAGWAGVAFGAFIGVTMF